MAMELAGLEPGDLLGAIQPLPAPETVWLDVKLAYALSP
jgi:hypothetical protein